MAERSRYRRLSASYLTVRQTPGDATDRVPRVDNAHILGCNTGSGYALPSGPPVTIMMTQREKLMPPLDPSVLDGPLQAAPPGMIDLAVEDSSVHRVSQLAHRGEVLEAARQAEALLADRVYDMRIIGYFLFGVFLERGIVYLPDVLRRVRDLLGDDFSALGPNRKKMRVVDAVLLWLFQSIDARIRFHAEFRDETWQSWLASSKPSLSMSISDAAAEVQIAANARLDDPQCIAALARVQRWASSDLGRALSRQGRPTAAWQSGEPSVELAADESGAAPISPVAPAAARSTRTTLVGTGQAASQSRTPPSEPLGSSPAMAALLAKMRTFEILIGRGDHAKAAIVASDIRHSIEHFDPVVYLPQLFADYFKALHRAIAEIAPHWQASGSPSWHALEQLYRTDPDAFLDE
jgi:hypothetical protein